MQQKNFNQSSKKLHSIFKDTNTKQKVFNNPNFSSAQGMPTEKQKEFIESIFKKGKNYILTQKEKQKWLSIFEPSDVFMELGKMSFSGQSTVNEIDVTISSSENDDEALLHSILTWTRESKPLKKSKSSSSEEKTVPCHKCKNAFHQ